jgi:hypothetical protein
MRARRRFHAAGAASDEPRPRAPDVGFHIIFERNGREMDAAIAQTGQLALAAAGLMLSRLDALQVGDILTCTEMRWVCRAV